MGIASIDRALALEGKGCLGKAADDEPVFTLRAQDISAPALVRAWANKAAGHLGYTHPKVIEAIKLAEAMEAWPNRKHPD